MELKGIEIDERTGKLIVWKTTWKFFPTSIQDLKDLFRPSAEPEITLTKEEAKDRGLDLNKNPKGFYTEIQGWRIPINIK